jgi:hypothetical protein
MPIYLAIIPVCFAVSERSIPLKEVNTAAVLDSMI